MRTCTYADAKTFYCKDLDCWVTYTLPIPLTTSKSKFTHLKLNCSKKTHLPEATWSEFRFLWFCNWKHFKNSNTLSSFFLWNKSLKFVLFPLQIKVVIFGKNYSGFFFLKSFHNFRKNCHGICFQSIIFASLLFKSGL